MAEAGIKRRTPWRPDKASRILPDGWDPEIRPPEGGPQTILTEQVAQEIVRRVCVGVSYASAARIAGVSRQALSVWLKRGRLEQDDPCSAYGALYNAIQDARAVDENNLVGTVRNAAQSSWRAALAMLAKRHSETWGDKVEVRSKQPLVSIAHISELSERIQVQREHREQYAQVIEELFERLARNGSRPALPAPSENGAE